MASSFHWSHRVNKTSIDSLSFSSLSMIRRWEWFCFFSCAYSCDRARIESRAEPHICLLSSMNRMSILRFFSLRSFSSSSSLPRIRYFPKEFLINLLFFHIEQLLIVEKKHSCITLKTIDWICWTFVHIWLSYIAILSLILSSPWSIFILHLSSCSYWRTISLEQDSCSWADHVSNKFL